MELHSHSLLQESLETQLSKPDILAADLSKMEVRRKVCAICGRVSKTKNIDESVQLNLIYRDFSYFRVCEKLF